MDIIIIFFWLLQLIADGLLIFVLIDSNLRNEVLSRFIKPKDNQPPVRNKRKEKDNYRNQTNNIESVDIVALFRENTANNQANTDKIIRYIQSTDKRIEQLCSGRMKSDPSIKKTDAPKEVNNNATETSNGNRFPRINYAFNASYNNPLAFSPDDLSDSKDDRPFIISIQSSNHATYSLVQDKDILRPLLNTISYYERLIDVENKAVGEVQRIEIISKGQLILESNIWVIKNKLKIRIL